VPCALPVAKVRCGNGFVATSDACTAEMALAVRYELTSAEEEGTMRAPHVVICLVRW
jgi:hypothetical protein